MVASATIAPRSPDFLLSALISSLMLPPSLLILMNNPVSSSLYKYAIRRMSPSPGYNRQKSAE